MQVQSQLVTKLTKLTDGTGTDDEDFTAYGVSYAVSDDVSVSYNVSTVDFEEVL